MNNGLIFAIKRFAVHDGPGIRTTVFFQGCPLHCAWCHNPESIPWNSPKITSTDVVEDQKFSYKESTGKNYTPEELVTEILKDAAFYKTSQGGITLSGGEPLSQSRFLSEFIPLCKARGISVVLDTSGYAPSSDFQTIASLCDLLLFDLKVMDPIRHSTLTGVDNALILQNLHLASNLGIPLWVRIPVIPGVNTSNTEIDAMTQIISSLSSAKQINLLPMHKGAAEKYRRLGKQDWYHNASKPSQDLLNSIKKRLSVTGIPVKQGG